MQLTIDASEPLDRVLAAVGALYGVSLTVTSEGDGTEPPAAAAAPANGGSGRRGRRPRRTDRSGQPARRGTRPATAQVREWAREQGMAISPRGRLSESLITAYQQAHAS